MGLTYIVCRLQQMPSDVAGQALSRDHVGVAQTPSKCWFCGGAGCSREHIIAQWISRLLRQQFDSNAELSFRHQWELPELGIPNKGKAASLAAFFTRSFCRECNGGWMGSSRSTSNRLSNP